jgi:hypothetical protein
MWRALVLLLLFCVGCATTHPAAKDESKDDQPVPRHKKINYLGGSDG